MGAATPKNRFAEPSKSAKHLSCDAFDWIRREPLRLENYLSPRLRGGGYGLDESCKRRNRRVHFCTIQSMDTDLRFSLDVIGKVSIRNGVKRLKRSDSKNSK